jgi:hypothetical protein
MEAATGAGAAGARAGVRDLRVARKWRGSNWDGVVQVVQTVRGPRLCRGPFSLVDTDGALLSTEGKTRLAVAKGKKVRESKDSVRLVCRDCAAEIHGGAAAVLPRRNSRRKPEDTEKVARALVSRLYEDILHEACVVFIGSGCTTEGRGWGHSNTFYDEIKAKSGFPSKALPPSFPGLMEYFCKQMDGGQHNRLIREAVSRIERFAVPGEDNYAATMFGEELAQIPYFSRFVTYQLGPVLREVSRDTDPHGRGPRPCVLGR